ncbi:hypothetical protein [Amycolatopsis sp. WAC 01375]|uniref:hypothetical protein n=1 Tax=Amycolatopsis sp. WAC 01375 TaxID=2203194 RepID=UPI001F1CFE3E|nr:hypothetical protein [Amycolatopsis sp. WAC 01375]
MIDTVREITTSLGFGTGAVGLVMVVVIQVAGRVLPTSSDGANIVTMGMATFAASALLLSGIAMTTAQSLVRTGYVETAGAILLRGVEAALCAGAVFAVAIFLVFYVPRITSSYEDTPHFRIEVTPGVVMYTLLPVLALVLTIVNAVVAHRLLFPAVGNATHRAAPGQSFIGEAPGSHVVTRTRTQLAVPVEKAVRIDVPLAHQPGESDLPPSAASDADRQP